MLTIDPTGAILGATVTGIDLSQPLSEPDFGRILLALGRPVPEPLREEYFFEVHFKAERAYEPKMYPGEMLVFYGDGLYEDPTLGWNGLAQSIRTFGVPGEHTSNRQAMFEPMVGFVAEKIVDYLGTRTPATRQRSAASSFQPSPPQSDRP